MTKPRVSLFAVPAPAYGSTTVLKTYTFLQAGPE